MSYLSLPPFCQRNRGSDNRDSLDGHCFWAVANFRFRWLHDFRVSHATAPLAHGDDHQTVGSRSKRSLIPCEMRTSIGRNSNFPETANASDCGSQICLRLISSLWQIALHMRIFTVSTLGIVHTTVLVCSPIRFNFLVYIAASCVLKTIEKNFNLSICVITSRITIAKRFSILVNFITSY